MLAQARPAWRTWTPPVAIATLLVLGTVALHARALGHGFLLYDDPLYVTGNPRVQGGLTWSSVAWAFRSLDAFNWHPLAWLSHMLDVELFGLRPWGHHLVNLLLHGLNAALLWSFLSSATGATSRSLAVAVLFAAHPLNVEAVAWVAERKELLAATFGLATLRAYVWYARRPTIRRYAAVAAGFALSLLAKPTWVTTPFLLVLLDVWPLQRVRASGATGPGNAPRAAPAGGRPLLRLALEKLPLLGLSAAASALALLAQRRGGATEALQVSLAGRVANAIVAYASYVGHALWPAGLSPFYPHAAGRLSAWHVAAAAALLLAVSALAVVTLRTAPWLAVGWCWFLGALVPVSGMVQVGAQGMADRYAYLPVIGLLVAAVWGAERLLGAWRHGVPLRIGAAAVVAVLAVASWRQEGFWSDDVTLFGRAIALAPDNGIAHLHVSQALAARGELVEALGHAREAVRLQPENARAHKNLGYVFHRLGLEDEAISALRAAIALDPGYAEAHGNLAIVYGRKGWTREAMEEMRTELQLRARAAP